MGWHCLGMLWERQQIRFQQLFAGRVRYWKLSFLCKEACPPGKGPFSLEYHQNEHPPVPSDNFNHGPFVDDLPPKNAGFPWPSFCWFSRNPMFWSNPSFQAPGGSSCITGGAKPPLFCGTVAFVGCFCKGWNTIGFLPDLYHWIPLWSLFWLTPTNGFITIYTRHDQSLMNQCHIPYINYVGLEYHWIYNYLYQ